MVMLLTGCAVNNPVDALDVDNLAVTGSAENNLSEELDQGDFDAIRQALENQNQQQAGVLTWQNENSGRSGLISKLSPVSIPDGVACHAFETTVDSFSGISVYKGEACQSPEGRWVLNKLQLHGE